MRRDLGPRVRERRWREGQDRCLLPGLMSTTLHIATGISCLSKPGIADETPTGNRYNASVAHT